MVKNIGQTDKIIRVGLAIVFLGLIFFANLGSVVNIILGVVAAVFILTSLVGTCPAYLPFKASTCKTEEAA